MAVESADQYCRAIEAHLCRKNDGHLIRIVGPAFERVLAWAEKGVPLRVACSGIDRYFERYYAKGPRRRPVRVEFCEADVLDAFDDWRRAVGLSDLPAANHAPGSQERAEEPARRHESLAAHLERVIARLVMLRAGATPALDVVLDATVRELDSARAGAKGLRGASRQALLDRLGALDRQLLTTARTLCEPDILEQFELEADAELAPFRGRMTGEALEHARRAAIDRLVRERSRLPTLAFD